MSSQPPIVIVNQAVNYLTIGLANAFFERTGSVVLITGSIHQQGESLHPNIKIQNINRWQESSNQKKMMAYLIACIRIWWLLQFKFRNHEVFLVSIPPMAYLLNLILPNRCSVLIWDVYPDVFKITGMSEQHPIYKAWSKWNKRSFNKMHRVITISERMVDLLEQYISREKIIIQPIWSIFQENRKESKASNPFIEEHNLQGKFIVQYSGNIGLTHNVEVLIDLAELMVNDEGILFQIIGRGSRKPHLEQLVKDRNLPNCMFLPFQSDDMFPYSLSAADVGVVILDESTSKGSVPSKSYNLMSYGIPSLYIAAPDSQLKVYTEKYGHGACFEKNQLHEAATFLRRIKKDSELYSAMSTASEIAAQDFKRGNADKIVDKYLQ